MKEEAIQLVESDGLELIRNCLHISTIMPNIVCSLCLTALNLYA